jgi:small subunit ribosomal protein S27e
MSAEAAPAPSRFVLVRCRDCSKEQVVFRRPATTVNCTICGALLATPTGGLGNFRGEVLRALA